MLQTDDKQTTNGIELPIAEGNVVCGPR